MSVTAARQTFVDPLTDYGEAEADLDTVNAWAAANGVVKVEDRYRIADVAFARAKAGLPKFKVVAKALDGRAAERQVMRGEVEELRAPKAARPEPQPLPVALANAPPLPDPTSASARGRDVPGPPASETDLIDIVADFDGTVTWSITPQLAGWLLALNSGNRPTTDRGIDRFVQILRRGAWRNTGEPIIVSREAVLNDGQHRLLAIKRSGIPAVCDIRFGIERAAFAVTGTAARRTNGNALAIAGKPNPASQAAIGRLLIHHDAGHTERFNIQIDSDEILAAVDAEPAVAPIADLMRPFRFKPAKSAAFGLALVLAHRTAKFERVAEFARLVEAGKADEEDATRRLHVRLRDAAIAKERLSQLDIAVLTVRAWNAWAAGKPVQLLKVTESDRVADGFPEIVQPGRVIKAFTPDEDIELEQRRVAGESLTQIATGMGRPKSSVQNRLAALARHGADEDG